MISIVIPNLNTSKHLKSTLESIMYQEGAEYELIVVDSHSDDGSSMILDDYVHRFRGKMRLELMEREGQVAAINYGMSLAKGDILAFINADDSYERGCFKTVEQTLKNGVEWLYGKGHVIDKEGLYTRGVVTAFKEIWQPHYNYRILTWFDYISQPTVFWKRSLWERIGEFNPKYKYVFDYEWWLRAGKFGEPVFVDRYLANWRAHVDSLSVANTDKQIRQALEVSKPYASGFVDRIIQELMAVGVSVGYKIIK
jgi:glycosyltransferase involved in cell wall biosynthesis